MIIHVCDLMGMNYICYQVKTKRSIHSYLKHSASLSNKMVKTDTRSKSKSTREIVQIFDEMITQSNIEWRLTADKYILSDVYIRWKDNCDGKWLRVQIRHSSLDKVCIKCNTMLEETFIVVCFTDTDDSWVIPHYECLNMTHIAISRSDNTKYTPYRTTKARMYDDVSRYLKTMMATIDVDKVTTRMPDKSLSYETIYNSIVSKGCKLLVSHSDFVEMKLNTKSLMDIEMSCGHDYQCSFNCFQRRKHFKCKECTDLVVKHKSYDEELRVTTGSKLEATSFTYIENIIKDYFDVRKTHEACLADMLIRKKGNDRDEWIAIQIKSRNIGTCQLSFNKIGKYPNMILLCVSFPSFDMWVFNGNDLIGQKCISIGNGKSKYSKFQVEKIILPEILSSMCDKLQKTEFQKLIEPITPACRKEHEYRMRREGLLSGLHFEYPKIDGTKYDVIINGHKVQDKCAVISNKRDHVYFGNYNKGDNDYYWVNMKDGSFFILPEYVIYKSKDNNSIICGLYLSEKYNMFRYNPIDNPNCVDLIKNNLFKFKQT